jgi:hypothetical protein
MEALKNIIGMTENVSNDTTVSDNNNDETSTVETSTVETSTVETSTVETSTVEDETPNNSLEAELARRNQQDSIWKVTNNPESTREDLNRIYTSILTESSKTGKKGVTSLKRTMLRQVHNGDMSKQGRAIDVPLDFHKGPYLNIEDEYSTIFEGESESKIRGNCNAELIRVIGGTEVTYGMKAYAEGVKWNNGLICYNKNNIVVRNTDNNFGQPGFLSGFFYYDQLGVEIMNNYLVTELIAKANRNEFTIMTDPSSVRNFISSRYQEVRQELEKRLELPNMTESQLFIDAPIREELNAPLSESDIKVSELERRVKILEEHVEFLLKRLEEVEDIALDSAINRGEKAIERQSDE